MVIRFYIISVMIMFLSGLLSFMSNQAHFLNSLLSLEMLAVSIYSTLSLSLYLIGGESLFSLFYLVILVCESVIGLGILVAIAYSHGSDRFKSINSVLC